MSEVEKGKGEGKVKEGGETDITLDVILFVATVLPACRERWKECEEGAMEVTTLSHSPVPDVDEHVVLVAHGGHVLHGRAEGLQRSMRLRAHTVAGRKVSGC